MSVLNHEGKGQINRVNTVFGLDEQSHLLVTLLPPNVYLCTI
ncbi:hypothetical protein [Hymenobacter sp. HDW8]|nr:hypothetical protein [Hymenobacter sp. HDW8]